MILTLSQPQASGLAHELYLYAYRQKMRRNAAARVIPREESKG